MDQRKVRALQSVRRLNFESCVRYQSVAEHSLLCGLLCLDAALRMGLPDREAFAAMAAGATHDLAEAVTGDIPYLVRRELGASIVAGLDARAEEELGFRRDFAEFRPLVEYCDALEFALYVLDERALGNSTLDRILLETLQRLARSPLFDKLRPWTLEVMGWTAEDAAWFEAAADLEEFASLKH